MKRIIGVLLLLASVSGMTSTAFSAPKYWIERDGGLFGNEYITDGKSKFSVGMFGTFDWSDEIAKQPAFAQELEQRNSDLRMGKIIYWSGFAAIIVAVFVPKDLFWVTLGAGLGVSLWGSHYGLKARQADLKILNKANGVKATAPAALLETPRFRSDRPPMVSMAWEF